MILKNFKDFEQIDENYKLSKIAKRDDFNGYEILIGRSAEMNDILTTEIAKEDDIWLHASGVPGSHIVVRKEEGEDVPSEVIHHAAELAAKNSKGSGKIRVIWTKAKYVTKDRKQKLGEVSVNYDKSHFININI
jgi:predicted ribosome quality control (RQC) complex YloA/Tae2 family protein